MTTVSSAYHEQAADKVNKLLAEAKAHSISTTRRQARKALHGRGRLMDQLREAREAAARAEAAQ